MLEIYSWLLWLFLAQAPAAEPPLQIGSVREALAAKRADRPQPPSGSFELSGYNFHWEVDLGNGTRAILISRLLEGRIMIFDAHGSLAFSLKTNEIVSLELFDFDNDGIAEMVTDQVDDRGTGILVKSFYIYKLFAEDFKEVWRGISYSHEQLAETDVSGSAKFNIKRGFIRCEPAGAGLPGPRLLHLVEFSVEISSGTTSKDLARHVYLMEDGTFREMTWVW